MTRDLIIGIVASIIFHVGFLWGGEVFRSRGPQVQQTVEETPTIDIVQMPELEPEEPEVFEAADDAPAEPIEFAPPMQADVVSVQIDTAFVQKLQPPPPPGLDRPQGVITIPKTSASRNIGAGMKDLFDLANLDQQPTPRFQAKPVYPFEMRRSGITGEVLVGFIVDSNGDVREAYAIRSTQREFEQAAIQAVSKWKFRPGRKGGRAVNTRMQVPIVFSISDD
jgi:periplasmic protein TonB